MQGNSVPQTLSYGDLNNLAQALATASDRHLMSLEESRAIWKTHLVKVGWKAQPGQKSDPKPLVKKTKKEVKK